MGARAVTAVKATKAAKKGPPAGPVFLSIGLPDPHRDPRYFTTADLTAIREAARALVTTVLPRASLVTTWHPALTPLLRLSASAVGAADRVRFYQSAFIAGPALAEQQASPDVVMVKPAKEDLEESVRKMRDAMMKSEAFAAGVFIGGMESVEQESALFARRHKEALVLPVASTGGAARLLFDQGLGPSDPSTREALASDTVYGALFTSLLGYA